jgi:hypothetical protein
MLDENGRQVSHRILSEKKDGDSLYLLVEAHGDDDEESEALILKCISDHNNGDDDDESEEMLLEHVDETHECFSIALELFEEDFENFDIET